MSDKKDGSGLTPIGEIGKPEIGEPDLRVDEVGGDTLDRQLGPPNKYGIYSLKDTKPRDPDDAISTLDGEVPTLEETPPKKGSDSSD